MSKDILFEFLDVEDVKSKFIENVRVQSNLKSTDDAVDFISELIAFNEYHNVPYWAIIGSCFAWVSSNEDDGFNYWLNISQKFENECKKRIKD